MTALSVPHFPQQADGGCLPACVQMVLAYLGIASSQADLARQLGTRSHIGTPHSRIVQLRSARLDVTWATGGAAALRRFIERGLPVIAFVQAAELPHWRDHKSRHAVVVIDMDDATVSVLDPAMPPEPQVVPLGDFMLAWDEMDNAYAVISLRQS